MDIVDEEEVKINVKQLVALDYYMEKNKNCVPPAEIEPVDTDMEISKKIERKTTKEYINYSDRDRERFFEYKLQRLLSVRAAVIEADVNPSTAKYWWNDYQKDPDSFILGKNATRKTKSNKSDQLKEEHKQYLIQYFDDYPQEYIVEAVEAFTKEFDNLEIKKNSCQ